MTWLAVHEAPTHFESVLAHRPELLTRFRSFYSALWSTQAIPRRVLELCRLRIAAIHDCEAEWVVRDAAIALDENTLAALHAGRFDSFASDEQAALAVAEQMPYGQHQVSDADVARLQSAFGSAGTVTLLTALAFFDVTCRLKCVFGVVPEPRELAAPPLAEGSLP
jgi:alkylhydroperoxidase family enzyme